jgi:NAD(P)-dependent dehydrogenase (short-subunit alcohol dehydrogenase family)
MRIEKGQVAVVTGAGGGIGRCIVQNLASKGVNLALVDINAETLKATQESIATSGVNSTIHETNITSEEQMQKLVEDVLAAHGGVHILINNAGITIQKSFENHSIQDWQRMIDINLWGVIYGCKFFLPALKASAEKGGAHIVNLSSMAAFVGLPMQSSYCAVKAGVHLLSESLWSELHDYNIGVTSVHPGAVKTDQKNYEFAQRIGATPEHAAERIVGAIANNRARIRIGKDSVILDILKRLLPKGILKPMIKVYRDTK